jgi:hypothetical protein
MNCIMRESAGSARPAEMNLATTFPPELYDAAAATIPVEVTY